MRIVLTVLNLVGGDDVIMMSPCLLLFSANALFVVFVRGTTRFAFTVLSAAYILPAVVTLAAKDIPGEKFTPPWMLETLSPSVAFVIALCSLVAGKRSDPFFTGSFFLSGGL